MTGSVGSVLTVVGARPQFVKAAPISRALAAAGLDEVLVHTGQHYDAAMSEVFFERMGIPAPKYDLGVGSGSHGAQTGLMLERLEQVAFEERPDLVLTYGDTNSTLAAALVAAKLNVTVAHVEAGLRSFNRRMPEEVNRVVTDHLSSLLFAPTDAAVSNLHAEGIRQGVHRTGDVMYDAVLLFRERITPIVVQTASSFGVSAGEFALATVHRAENTDDPKRWNSIVDAFRTIASDVCPIVWPVHPRARRLIADVPSGVIVTDPLPYFEMQALLMGCRVVLTDSGGLQKEAAFHSKPCVTLRDETEWVELVAHEVNQVVGAEAHAIVSAVRHAAWPTSGIPSGLYGDGFTSRDIARIAAEFVTSGRTH